MTSPDPVFRRATDSDAAGIADVWLRSFGAALPGVHRAHTDDEVRDWIASIVVPEYETWIAVADGTVVGLLVLDGGELEQLYLEPTWRGRGLGDRFVAIAKQRRPAGLQLWTFQVNETAQRFYERHGFVEIERTDGRANESREPDIRYAWLPRAVRQNVSSGSPLEPQIGFSRAVRKGAYVVVAGTAPIGDDGTTVGPGDVYAQTVRCLAIAEAALIEAGASLADVVRTRMMLTDMTRWKEAARAHGERFADIRPACTFVEVSGFIDPEWLVEVELDAVLG